MSKTFFGRLLADIASIFGSIFKHVIEGAKKTFDELPQATRDALIHGSGVMDVIKTMLTNTPDEILAAIKEKFPNIDPAALETGLFAVAHGFNLLPKENDLKDCIAVLQGYLSKLQGNTWDTIMHSGAALLAVIFAPAGTQFGAVVSLLEYVYQTFFAKKAA